MLIGRDEYDLLNNTRLFVDTVFIIVETIKALNINSKNIPFVNILSNFFYPHATIFFYYSD